jgi:hypothetical protein
MTFLAPGFLLAAAAAAAVTVGLHFLVTRQPPSASLPTARFIPVASTTIVAAARRPRDLLLLLVRVAAFGLVGMAFARPQLTSHRSPVMRIVVADRSRDVADIHSVRDSVRRLLRAGDMLVVFDSAAHAVPPAHAMDTAASLQRMAVRGTLSSALIVARREASRWRGRADSLELDLVSPLADDELDAGTPAVRALWGGRVRVVRMVSARGSIAPPMLTLRGPPDDPLRVAAPFRTGASEGPPIVADARAPALATDVRVVRDQPTAADSTWTRIGHGHTLVVWPAMGATAPWPFRRPADTVAAVVVFRPAAVVVVAAFSRTWRLGAGAHVSARWVDGDPAAVEHTLGAGCVRDVAIGVPTSGDLVLRPEFARLVATLVRPCGDTTDAAIPASPSDVAMLAGTGRLFATGAIETSAGVDDPIVPWLLGAALLLVAVEVLARRGRSRQAALSGPAIALAGPA